MNIEIVFMTRVANATQVCKRDSENSYLKNFKTVLDKIKRNLI